MESKFGPAAGPPPDETPAPVAPPPDETPAPPEVIDEEDVAALIGGSGISGGLPNQGFHEERR